MRPLKSLILIFVIINTSICYGVEWEEYDDPKAPFLASHNRQTIDITWKYAKDVPNACNAENLKIGVVANFSSRTVACAMWRGNTCLIITGKKTTSHSVGHEIRHCFQGGWHPDTARNN